MTTIVRLGTMAVGLGALAFLSLGSTPARVQGGVAGPAAWVLPVPAERPNPASLAAWQRPVWASQPTSLTPSPADEVEPMPTLLGVFIRDGDSVALFKLADGSRLRRTLGETLPSGARIVAIESTRVTWRLLDGSVVESRVFSSGEPQRMNPDE